MLRTILHYAKRGVILLTKLLIALVPKNKKMVLFSAWFGKKYSDSSMYMFEYMQTSNYKVVWYTLDKSIYDNLKHQGKYVVYGKSFKGIITQIRAKMLVSSVQFADFNPYFLSRCIYLDLDHGFPIKDSGFEIQGVRKRDISYAKLLRFNIKYYMSASSSFVQNIISRCFYISKNNIVKCNKPRTDVFFDPLLRQGKNEIVNRIKGHRKAIVYMPTQRSCGKVPIEVGSIFDLKKINDFCERNNAVFIIKKHYYHKNERTDCSLYQFVFDITHEDIETQTLLFQADVLISDYSACYIDYLLLDRPIILYPYDLEDFLNNERKLYLPFEKNVCGFHAYNFDSLLHQLNNILDNNWSDTLSKEREEIRSLYFSKNLVFGESRKEILSIIERLINKQYKPNWEGEGESK